MLFDVELESNVAAAAVFFFFLHTTGTNYGYFIVTRSRASYGNISRARVLNVICTLKWCVWTFFPLGRIFSLVFIAFCCSLSIQR